MKPQMAGQTRNTQSAQTTVGMSTSGGTDGAHRTARFAEKLESKFHDFSELSARTEVAKKLRDPYIFIPVHGGNPAFGYEATALIDLCELNQEVPMLGLHHSDGDPPMINCKYDESDPTYRKIQEQIARMEQLEGFPFGAPAKRDLCLALCTADSIEEARAVIDEFKSKPGSKCPTDADIRVLIHDRHAEIEQSRPSRYAECPICHGSGVIVVKAEKRMPWGEVREYEGVKDCTHSDLQQHWPV